MNPRTEQRLRAAFEAKADQVTEERLTARRQLPAPDFADDSDGSPAITGPTGSDVAAGTGSRGPRPDPAWRAHWLAPALAAAAVAAVAARAQRPPTTDGPAQAHAQSGQPDQHEPAGDA